MANAVASRIGSINSATDKNALFLKVFSAEVLATFMRENQMLGMSSVRSISQGKTAQFPVIGTTSASQDGSFIQECISKLCKFREGFKMLILSQAYL